MVEREFSSDEPFHPRDPPFRGTLNLTTRSQRLHHVAPVLSEPRQSSLVCPEAFFSLPRSFPHQPGFPLLFPRLDGVETEGIPDRSSSPNLISPVFHLGFRWFSKRNLSLFYSLIKRGIEINEDCIVERYECWSFNL